MGSSASKEEAPPEAAAGGFSVRMTPELLQRASESSANTEAPVTTTRGEIEEQLQLAFQQGAEYAVGVMRQQAAEEGSKGAGAQIADARDESARREAEINAKVEALHEREYRPPFNPRACTEQRAAVLECYQRMSGQPAGETVFACEAAVNKFVECADFVRTANIEKIVPNSLPSVSVDKQGEPFP